MDTLFNGRRLPSFTESTPHHQQLGSSASNIHQITQLLIAHIEQCIIFLFFFFIQSDHECRCSRERHRDINNIIRYTRRVCRPEQPRLAQQMYTTHSCVVGAYSLNFDCIPQRSVPQRNATARRVSDGRTGGPGRASLSTRRNAVLTG